MRRLLAALLLVAAPAWGQNVETKRVSAETKRVDGSSTSGATGTTYNSTTDTVTGTGTIAARNLTATALATPGAITVTPVLSKIGAITVVAGSALADGDGLVVGDGTGTVPIEFDASPGDGTTGGAVPIIFDGTETATEIRDAVKAILDGAGRDWTTSAQGADGIGLVRATPGATGGGIAEDVTDPGFLVTDWTDPTHATTVTYQLVACLADGTCTQAGADSTTAVSTATLSASNFLRLSWSAVTGAASYKVYRKTAPTTPATVGIVYSGTALTVDDTGLVGDTTTAPTLNGTGVLTGRGVLGNGTTVNGTFSATGVTALNGTITLTALAAPSAPTVTATAAGSKPAGTWNYKTTWIVGSEETELGTASANITVDGTKAVRVTQPTGAPANATAWKVYSSRQGPTAAWYVTSGTLGTHVTTYSDNAGDAALLVNATYRDAVPGRRVNIAGQSGGLILGVYNVILGNNAGKLNMISHDVTAVGANAASGLTTGDWGSFYGKNAGANATTGNALALFGMSAGLAITTASYTSVFGGFAGDTITTGDNNSVFGGTAGRKVTTGANNTFVGYGADLATTTQRSNATAIGSNARVDADNRVVIGDAAVVDVWAGTSGQAQLYADSLRLSGLNTAPASATATGTAGDIRWTADYVYLCIATDTWVRAALVTWP